MLLGPLALGGTALAQKNEPHTLLGRWDLTVKMPEGPDRASWLEVELSGVSILVGAFVGPGGSVRPISEVDFHDGRFSFQIPTQWEQPRGKVRVEGRLDGGELRGEITGSDGSRSRFTGVRAPELRRVTEPDWASPLPLFDGKTLNGWQPRFAGRPLGWVVEGGLLRNREPVNGLVSDRKFDDFRLRARFRYPAGSNSGIYLRGRYEIQIQDDYGKPPSSHGIGGIYGFVRPRVNAALPAGEWQLLEAMLVGRFVTLDLNGRRLADWAEIPGVTGGAIDSREAEPGPIFVQGDHGPIDFSELIVTPARA